MIMVKVGPPTLKIITLLQEAGAVFNLFCLGLSTIPSNPWRICTGGDCEKSQFANSAESRGLKGTHPVKLQSSSDPEKVQVVP